VTPGAASKDAPESSVTFGIAAYSIPSFLIL
jgi:hypothetical protein